MWILIVDGEGRLVECFILVEQIRSIKLALKFSCLLAFFLPRKCVERMADTSRVQQLEIRFELRLQPWHGVQEIGGRG